jgi:hypothetical protein
VLGSLLILNTCFASQVENLGHSVLFTHFLKHLFSPIMGSSEYPEPHIRINPRVPSRGVDTEHDFHPVVSSFHPTHKADKIRYCYLSNGRTLFTHKETGGHYFSPRELC